MISHDRNNSSPLGVAAAGWSGPRAPSPLASTPKKAVVRDLALPRTDRYQSQNGALALSCGWGAFAVLRSRFPLARRKVTAPPRPWTIGGGSDRTRAVERRHRGSLIARAAPVLDFCFIDGGHGFGQIVRDLRTLREACRVMVFHDIVNVRGWDVPSFWRNITDKASPLHPAEFTAHECIYQPPLSDGKLMGIGVLAREAHTKRRGADE